MNTISWLASAVMVVVLAVSQTGLAAAQQDGPSCRIIAPTRVIVNESVNFVVESSLTSKAAVDFDDGTDPEFTDADGYVAHTFHFGGEPTIVATIVFGRSAITCSHDMTVRVSSAIEAPDSGGTEESPNNKPSKPELPTSVGDVSTSLASGSITGDDNIAPVINGDQNEVTITIEQPAPVQITEPETPKPLGFWQKFWLPWKSFWRGIVAILTGWFDLDVP